MTADEITEAFRTFMQKRQSHIGLTNADLASAAGLHTPNVYKLYAGTHSPTLKTMVKVLEALGCEMEVKFRRKR